MHYHFQRYLDPKISRPYSNKAQIQCIVLTIGLTIQISNHSHPLTRHRFFENIDLSRFVVLAHIFYRLQKRHYVTEI